jgi:RNA polymerase sigma factor (sigma-70 family)
MKAFEKKDVRFMINTVNDEFIKSYSKKIFGFAYSKTGNVYNAEDLAQEILLSLSDVLSTPKDIADLDGYVWTICYYTWSKYLRKNKNHWQGVDIEEAFDVQNNCNVEEEVILNEELEYLQREISYLSRQHRQITIMFYFENKSCEEISKVLNISNGSVRWHLYEIRKKLKEGIGMHNENLSYIPQRLMVGHDGYTGLNGQAGLEKDLLCQNIIIACYGEALMVEEISRKLGVAAAYLENHINDLLFLDYLKIVDKNKYQTNFFIREPKHVVLTAKYQYENIGDIAQKIYLAFDKRYSDIKSIGFTGNDLDKDFLLWSIMPLYIGVAFWQVNGKLLAQNNIKRPKRKDGSEHWVWALFYNDDYYKNNDIPEYILDFNKKSNGNGIKTRDTKLNVHSLQLDSYATIKSGITWRDFDDNELNELYRIRYLIDSHEKPNENDKLIISKMVDLGYVKVENETPRILIPFFDKVQYMKLQEIFNDIKEEVGEDLFTDYINNYAKEFEKYIPNFVSKDERYFMSHNIYPHYAVLYYLADKGWLRYPTDEEAKRVCTVLWCE